MLFDAQWYLRTLRPGVEIGGGDALNHYLNAEGFMDGDPNPMFDREWYFAQHPALQAERRNPLLHYIEVGERLGSTPSRDFDPTWYSTQYPDVKRGDGRLLAHFLRFGLHEGRRPKPLHPHLSAVFDADYYVAQFGVEHPAGDPLNHYLYAGGHLDRNPNNLFDTAWYMQRHGEIESEHLQPLIHYLEVGEPAGCAPGPDFDPKWYAENYPQVPAAGLSLLGHYIRYGRNEGYLPRRPLPNVGTVFDPDWYLAGLHGIKPQGTPLEHYMAEGYLEHDPNPLFDTAWYVEQHPGLAESGENPLLHYLQVGEPQGDPPSLRFDPRWYVENYPDVAAAGISALAHYLEHGTKEGRMPKRPRHFEEAQELMAFLSGLAPSVEPVRCSMTLALHSLAQMARTNGGRLGVQSVYFGAEHLREGVVDDLQYPGPAQVLRCEHMFALAGTRYLVSPLGAIAHDEDAHFHDQPGSSIKYHGARRLPKGKGLQLHFGLRQGAWIERGINVMHEYENNYFHFIAESIPRMMLAEEAGIPPEVPLLCADDLHPNIAVLFERANFGGRPVLKIERGTMYRVEEMYYPSDLTTIVDAYEGGGVARQSCLDVQRIRRGISHCRTGIVAPTGRRRRIFASRAGAARKLLNQIEIEERLVAVGFEVVRSDELSLEEQIAIFQEAEMIVGPTGAQISNIVWCPPATELVVLASDHPSHQLYLWELLGRVSNAKVSFMQGPRAYSRNDCYSLHDDYSIDVDALVELLKVRGNI